MKCKKCGCLLAERNLKKCICDSCQESRKNKLLRIFLSFVTIITLSVIGFYIIDFNISHPVTYEKSVVSVIGKEEKVIPFSTGKTIGVTKKYYLTVDNDEEINVSPAIFNKTDIGDYITLTYKIRDGKIIEQYYKEGF